jgi:hypothetical protein
MTEDGDVLVRLLDDRNAMVIPPQDTDTDNVVGVKLFLMACLHRRVIDEGFDDNMREWVQSFTPEEFKAAVQEKSRRVQH